jgi:hypothetical protein
MQWQAILGFPPVPRGKDRLGNLNLVSLFEGVSLIHKALQPPLCESGGAALAFTQMSILNKVSFHQQTVTGL